MDGGLTGRSKMLFFLYSMVHARVVNPRLSRSAPLNCPQSHVG
jgi:hypothetical protein